MGSRSFRRIAAGLAASGCATLAVAQPAPTLEIDFVPFSGVPLSPALTLAIAAVVAVLGVLALRRARIRSRASMPVVLAIAMAVVAGAPGMRPFGEARAIPVSASLSLVTSPATVNVSIGVLVEATNNSSAPIALTVVTLQNAPGLFIVPAALEPNCRAGLTLQPGGACWVQIGAPV